MNARFLLFSVALIVHSVSHVRADSIDLAKWQAFPNDGKKIVIADTKATIAGEKWQSLRSPDEYANAELTAKVTILEPSKQQSFFGQSWSAWTDRAFDDGGFDAALLLRAGKDSGYRAQLSQWYQAIALVKYPEGGYVSVVPCTVKQNETYMLRASLARGLISVSVDGQEKIKWHDPSYPIERGKFGIAVSGGAKASFSEVTISSVRAVPLIEAPPHKANFTMRKFLGGRRWIFDGNEPILQLHNEKDPSCFAKLKPGYKPQLTFDSHWGIENQGAFPDGASKWTEPEVTGSGESIKATWSARNVKDRFTTRSTLTVAFDAQRGTYAYDIESQLEVLPGKPFQFRYGFDFEHHTPLDPFNWQYLIAKRRGGDIYHRPVYPIDPGPQNDLETCHGVRVWYGRHNEALRVAPAVEYTIDPDWNRPPKETKSIDRKLNTAVCAAFYDTGVSFEPETAAPGTKIRVKYRYTGYTADEAEAIFKQSKIYDSPTLDPNHHYLFADEWPKLTFSKFEPMSKTWIYGRTPFMTGHNQRPTYELEKNCGAGSGYAMKLGPASYGKANWPMPMALEKGRYVLTALIKSINAHGPGGRIELEAAQAKTGKSLAQARYFVGNGSFDWKRQGFVFEVPETAGTLSLALGNTGTGAMLVTDVEFRKLAPNEALPDFILPKSNAQAPEFPKAPEGAIADFRMEEGKGHHVLNYAGGEHLQLANLDWVSDAGHPALRFADNPMSRKDYLTASSLALHYFKHPAYAGKDTLPIALSGTHGGGSQLKGLTLSAWIKPAAEMGKSTHGGKGDVIGYGARRFILSLQGHKAPYQLAARINVNDTIASQANLEADRWYHVAMTAAPADGQWRIELFVDGKPVGYGITKKFAADSVVPHSIVLGAELFYFHDAYYRGLIGRTLVFNRALSADEIRALAANK